MEVRNAMDGCGGAKFVWAIHKHPNASHGARIHGGYHAAQGLDSFDSLGLSLILNGESRSV